MSASVLLSLLVAAADPCVGVMDKSVNGPSPCSAPAAVSTAIAADPIGEGRRTPDAALIDAAPPIDPAAVQRELAVLAFAFFAAGTGVTTVAAVSDPRLSTFDRETRDAGIWLGVGLLGWSALIGCASAAIWVFDPSSGEMRFKELFPPES